VTDPAVPALRETLAALEMPEEGLRKWFAHLRRFCDAHGGARTYGDLLALLDDCSAVLARKPGEA
jgi:hypothetical protein